MRGHARLLSPLLAGSLERGLNLAEAMEARGYGRPGATARARARRGPARPARAGRGGRARRSWGRCGSSDASSGCRSPIRAARAGASGRLARARARRGRRCCSARPGRASRRCCARSPASSRTSTAGVRGPGRGRRPRHAAHAPGRARGHGRDALPGPGGPGRDGAASSTRSRSGSRTSASPPARDPRRASPRRSDASARAPRRAARRTSSRAASSSACASRPRSRCGRSCCCSTSRPRSSTRRAPKRSSSWRCSAAPRSCVSEHRAERAARRRRPRALPRGRARCCSTRAVTRRARGSPRDRPAWVEPAAARRRRASPATSWRRSSGVSFAYGDRTVLDGAELELRRGEIVALERPERLREDDAREARRRAARAGAGTGRAGRAAPRTSRRIPAGTSSASAPTRRSRSASAAISRGRGAGSAASGSRACGDRHPRDLSSGERERLALAAVLAVEPDLLVLDEPTRGVDPERKAELAELPPRAARGGAATLVVTHDEAFAAAVADRVVGSAQREPRQVTCYLPPGRREPTFTGASSAQSVTCAGRRWAALAAAVWTALHPIGRLSLLLAAGALLAAGFAWLETGPGSAKELALSRRSPARPPPGACSSRPSRACSR